jgi:hypothetical protein
VVILCEVRVVIVYMLRSSRSGFDMVKTNQNRTLAATRWLVPEAS